MQVSSLTSNLLNDSAKLHTIHRVPLFGGEADYFLVRVAQPSGKSDLSWPYQNN